MRIEPVKMSEEELVRPHYLCNSTGQLVRVKQWLPVIRLRRTTSQNLDKNNDKSQEQSNFSSNQRTRIGRSSSQRFMSESDVMATKKDNLRRVANHQKSRVIMGEFLNYVMGGALSKGSFISDVIYE